MRSRMKGAAAAAVDRFGAIDVIVNNAGVMPLAFFADHERKAGRQIPVVALTPAD